MRLVVTRPAEDSQLLAARLLARGHTPIVVPLLTIEPRRNVFIPDRSYQAVLITSANGARALARQTSCAKLTRHPALTVGAQSRGAAIAAGFTHVESRGGDVIGLAAHIVETRRPNAGPLLYASGAETAGDLAKRLASQGFDVDRIVLYDAVPTAALPADADDADGALFYSPRTAKIWGNLTPVRLPPFIHFCLSENVAKALPPEAATSIAGEPNEESMLTLIDSFSGVRPRTISS